MTKEFKSFEEFTNVAKEAAVKLHKWVSEAQVNVVNIEHGINSYNYKIRTIKLVRNCRDHNYYAGHEYGHSIFRDVYDQYGLYPDCTDIKHTCDELCADCHTPKLRGATIAWYLNDKCSEYNLNRSAICPLSDFMGMYANTVPFGYPTHDAGYVESFADYYGETNLIYEDEWFANICGLLYAGWRSALYAIHDMYPRAVEDCLDIIDKEAMQILSEM